MVGNLPLAWPFSGYFFHDATAICAGKGKHVSRHALAFSRRDAAGLCINVVPR
jgi:hypothetical protein